MVGVSEVTKSERRVIAWFIYRASALGPSHDFYSSNSEVITLPPITLAFPELEIVSKTIV